MSAFDWFVQGIGFVCLILNVVAFQCKKHRWIMFCKSGCEMLSVIQYILLGAYTGACFNSISGIRNIIFARLVETKRSTLAFQILFGVFFLGVGIFTWEGPISICVIFAKVVSTVAYGMKNPALLRLIALPTCVCWVAYNVYAGSAGGAIGDALHAVSIIVAMIRFDLPELRRCKI